MGHLHLTTMVLALCACTHQPQQQRPAIVQQKTFKVDASRVLRTLPGPCASFVHDYEGLYPILDTLPNITQDSIHLDTLLKAMGMTYSSSGWGNWEHGPRIFSMKLTAGPCTCDVHKAYFYNAMRPDSTWDLRVTERVICNVPDSLAPWWTTSP
ncbi:MAG: hypothetical protein JNM62_13815 [Flavobacteriales bacterium]|nr:hypothetical protein [Flavobacteriales bacterium]